MSQVSPLRLAAFGQSGPQAGAGLQALMRHLGAAAEVALVVEAPGHKRRPQSGFRWGWLQAAARGAQAAGDWDLERLARDHGLPYQWCEHGDDSAVLEACRRHRIDLGVCFCLPFRLSSRLRQGAHEILNLHPSPLPRWRGAAPLFWWLRSGEPQTALSVHLMRHALDAGPVLATQPWHPPLRAGGEQLMATAGELGGRLLARVVEAWARGRRQARAQATAGAERAPRPRPEDGHLQPRLWPTASLARFLAGAPFFVTPSFRLGGERFFVADDAAAVQVLPPSSHLPGDFAQVGSLLYVRARDGVVACRIQR